MRPLEHLLSQIVLVKGIVTHSSPQKHEILLEDLLVAPLRGNWQQSVECDHQWNRGPLSNFASYKRHFVGRVYHYEKLNKTENYGIQLLTAKTDIERVSELIPYQSPDKIYSIIVREVKKGRIAIAHWQTYTNLIHYKNQLPGLIEVVKSNSFRGVSNGH